MANHNISEKKPENRRKNVPFSRRLDLAMKYAGRNSDQPANDEHQLIVKNQSVDREKSEDQERPYQDQFRLPKSTSKDVGPQTANEKQTPAAR